MAWKRAEKNASEVKPKFNGISANAFSEYVNSQLVYPYAARKMAVRAK